MDYRWYAINMFDNWLNGIEKKREGFAYVLVVGLS
jgi:hypothetical protein